MVVRPGNCLVLQWPMSWGGALSTRFLLFHWAGGALSHLGGGQVGGESSEQSWCGEWALRCLLAAQIPFCSLWLPAALERVRLMES